MGLNNGSYKIFEFNKFKEINNLPLLLISSIQLVQEVPYMPSRGAGIIVVSKLTLYRLIFIIIYTIITTFIALQIFIILSTYR